MTSGAESWRASLKQTNSLSLASSFRSFLNTFFSSNRLRSVPDVSPILGTSCGCSVWMTHLPLLERREFEFIATQQSWYAPVSPEYE